MPGHSHYAHSDDSDTNFFLPAENDKELKDLLHSNHVHITQKLLSVHRKTLSATVYHMLLALAKPCVWAKYSRDGKRGKKNATDIGVVSLITHAVAKQLKKEENLISGKVATKLSEALKRMPSTCRALEKKSVQQEATTESVTSESDTTL